MTARTVSQEALTTWLSTPDSAHVSFYAESSVKEQIYELSDGRLIAVDADRFYLSEGSFTLRASTKDGFLMQSSSSSWSSLPCWTLVK